MTQRSSSTRSPARVILIVCFNLIVIAALLEVGARIVYPIVRFDSFTWAELLDALRNPNHDEAIATADAVRAPPGSPYPILHPYLGYVMQPGTEMITLQGDTLRYSQFGFFGDEPVFERKEDEAVIAISGGSVALSLWHNQADYIAQELSKLPEFSGKRIRVQSFALGGYKQPQMLQALTYLLSLGVPIDLWIELDGFNDVVLPVSENLPAGDPVEFPRDWRVLAATAPPPSIAALRERIEREKIRREKTRVRFAATPLAHSAFVLAWWDILDQRSRVRLSALIEEVTETSRGLRTETPPEQRDAVLRRSVDVWKRSSIQMDRICKANGIAYYHFVQPNQYHADSKLFSDEEKLKALVIGGYQPAASMGYPLLVEAAAELKAQGFPVYDLTMMFRDEPRTVYRDSCCHFNDLGNQLMAEAVVSVILDR